MRKILFIIALFLSVRVSYAQDNNDKITIYGRLLDSFTYELLHPATMDILSIDSTVIVEGISSLENADAMGRTVNFIAEMKREHKEFILRFNAEGYETAYTNMKLVGGKRAIHFSFDDVFIEKEAIELDEIFVVATQIRMVMKGDTLVYNANAFQLSQGSMLDALISQLPGVQLNDGRITVNGRFVSSLLLNGEDFFSGDPKIALDNLPAYMVDNVKVYEKAPEHAYITGQNKLADLPLVLDVNLKRQYNTGWIANTEAGYGSHDRWIARAFGLRFTDQSRISLFANVNNINDTRSPGTSSNWRPDWAPVGLTTIKYGGIEMLLKDKEEVWKLNSYIKGLYEGIDNVSQSSTKNFFNIGNTYQRGINDSKLRRNKLIMSHDLELQYPNMFGSAKLFAEYADGNTDLFIKNAEFNANPHEAYRGASLDTIFSAIPNGLINKTFVNGSSNETTSRSRSFQGLLEGKGYVKIANLPDFVSVGLMSNYRYRENQEYSHYSLLYGNNTANNNIFQNRYINTPSIQCDVTPSIIYNYDGYLGNKRLVLTPSYEFKFTYDQSTRDFYRLDKLNGWGRADSIPTLGGLPSNQSAMQAALDMQNSYYSRQSTSAHVLSMTIAYYINEKFGIGLRPRITIQRDQLDYSRAEIDTSVIRSYASFGSLLQLASLTNENFKLNYIYSESRPSLVRLLNTRDDVNPLVVRLGNPSLKNTRQHSFSIRQGFKNSEKRRNMTFKGEYNIYENAIAQSLTYNSETGIRTYLPINVDGNWNANAAFDLSKSLDKEWGCVFTNNTKVDYNNSVDYTAINDVSNSIQSNVSSLKVSEGASINYYGIKLKADGRWLYATSSSPNFETINCFDFNYGISGHLSFDDMIGLELTTDFTVYSRRGYNDALMNDDHLVWNLRLERSFLEGNNLIVGLEWFDLLGELSNVRQTINAQGMVETWYNTIPQYTMLRVSYRLSREPKKK